VARLALVMWCADHAAEPVVPSIMPARPVERAIAIIGYYDAAIPALVEVSRIASAAIRPAGGADDLKLEMALPQAGAQGLSRGQIRRDVFSHHRPAATVAAMLDRLTKAGLVRLALTERRGQPTDIYIWAARD